MKARRTIYLITGIICVLVNLFIWLSPSARPPSGDVFVDLRYYAVRNILVAIGILLLRAAWRVNRKLKLRARDHIVDILGIDSNPL